MLVGILGALGTILAPIVALYMQKRIDNKDKTEMSFSRRKALSGKWKGVLTHHNPLDHWKTETDCEISLNPGQHKIDGKVFYNSFQTGKSIGLILRGVYKNDRYISLEYENDTDYISQFGFLIIELSSNGKIISGKLVGFGPESEKLITAEIKLSKVAE